MLHRSIYSYTLSTEGDEIMKMIALIGKHIKNWWKNYTMSPIEQYLSQSTDVVDLEHRLRTVSSRMINKSNGVR